MKRIFLALSKHPKLVLAALVVAAAFGFHAWKTLPVDVFPDIPVPRVTLQTEAGGLTAEEVEQLVRPIRR